MTGSHARRGKPTRYDFSARSIGFDDRRGHLFVPDRPADAPVVVLAPGAGLQWRPTLEATAERLAARGYAVVVFDHRGFETIDGDGLLSPSRQRADLDAAIEAAREAPEVDGDRLALWGMDLSAGTALAAAAETFHVDAVVARFPVLTGKALLPAWVRPRLAGLARGFVDYPVSLVDRIRGVEESDRGLRVPLFGEPGEVAAIAAPGAKRGMRAVTGRESRTTPARSLVKLSRHDRHEVLGELTCPTLFVAGSDDELAPPETVAAASEQVADASLVRVPTDHYGALDGEGLERTLNHELAFLDAELGDRDTKHL